MKIRRDAKGLWITALACLIMMAIYSQAFAEGRPRGGHHEEVRRGRERYDYRDGRFYKPGWFGFNFMLNLSPVGVVVRALPVGHGTIIINGSTYYYYEHTYYRRCPSGYIVVEQPVPEKRVIYTAPATDYGLDGSTTVKINVPNPRGGFNEVILVRTVNGYIGPQGEYYSGNPTVRQLSALYGK
jgi:hypothetical protein